MTDQPFQPATTDPTQVQTPSQGGVFGGFVGVEEAPVSKIPDTSVLFGDSSEPVVTPQETPAVENTVVDSPVIEEITNFGDLNIGQTESANPSPFEEAAPVVEEVVEEVLPTMDEVPVVEETIVEPIAQVEPAIEEIIPEPTVESPVVEEITPNVNETPDFAVAPVVEEVIEPIAQEAQTVQEVMPDEEAPVVSDVKAKYNELANNIKSLVGANTAEQSIDIVGSNTDTSHVEYTFTRDEDILEVTRTELNKQTNEETDNTIAFVSELEEGKIQVYLDDTLLFEEQELQEDPKKKMQVMEKFNKFIFLTGEKLKDFEKARKAQEAELQEKRRLQDIFRNF